MLQPRRQSYGSTAGWGRWGPLATEQLARPCWGGGFEGRSSLSAISRGQGPLDARLAMFRNGRRMGKGRGGRRITVGQSWVLPRNGPPYKVQATLTFQMGDEGLSPGSPHSCVRASGMPSLRRARLSAAAGAQNPLPALVLKCYAGRVRHWPLGHSPPLSSPLPCRMLSMLCPSDAAQLLFPPGWGTQRSKV